MAQDKVRIAITIGDINGISVEIILKAFTDSRLFDYCIPVVYGSSSVLGYHRKNLKLDQFNYHIVKEEKGFSLNPKVINIVNCWEEDAIITLGQPSAFAGKCAIKAVDRAIEDLKKGLVDVMVTAPLNKDTVEDASFTGHTEYLTDKFGVNESLMLMISEDLRIGLVTNHLPIKDVAENITPKTIGAKLEILDQSLKKDFGLNGPKIGVLGLNPHSGDNGRLGEEDKQIIEPSVLKARDSGILAFGPYSADGYFGSGEYKKFDATLAMYHDQGLVGFKSLSFGNGANYTAGLPYVRTSPDHGVAYELAGQGKARSDSFQSALFSAMDIYRNRVVWKEYHRNKKSKVSEDTKKN